MSDSFFNEWKSQHCSSSKISYVKGKKKITILFVGKLARCKKMVQTNYMNELNNRKSESNMDTDFQNDWFTEDPT